MGVVLGGLAGWQHDLAMPDPGGAKTLLQRREPERADLGIGDDEGAGARRELRNPLAGVGDEIGADQDVIGARPEFYADARCGGGDGGSGHVG